MFKFKNKNPETLNSETIELSAPKTNFFKAFFSSIKNHTAKRNFKNSIAFKFEIILLPILLICFTGLSAALIKSIGNDNIQTYTDLSSTIADKTSTVLSYWLDSYFKDLRVFTKSQAFFSGDIEEAKNYMLENKRLIGMDFDRVGLIDINGYMYDSDGNEGDASSELFYSEVVGKGRSQYISNPELSASGEYVFYISAPLYNSNNAIYGCFFAVVPIRVINYEVSKTNLGNGSYVYAIDGNGTIIAHNDPSKITQNLYQLTDEETGLMGYKELTTRMVMSQTGNGTVTDKSTGTTSYIFFTPIYGTDWSLGVVIPQTVVNSSAFKSGVQISFISGIIAVIILIITSIYINILLKPLVNLKKSILEIASGDADLTHQLDVKTQDEIGDVVRGFNTFTGNLRHIISRVKESKDILHSVDRDMQNTTSETEFSINQIITHIDNVTSQIENQSNSVTETASAVNEIAHNIENLNKLIENQSSGVSEASSAVEQMLGNIISVSKSTEHMVNSFNELESHTNSGISKQNSVNEQINQIKEQSNMLMEANKTISKIASETNLLAMNASIEAAHAGEAGRGFSVVADEIHALSETSSLQSKRIGKELQNIQKSIQEVVLSSAEAKNSFEAVTTKIRDTDQLVRQIQGAMEESEVGSQQITNALKMMNESTMEVRTASGEMSQGNKAILDQVEKLQNATNQIKNSMNEMTSGANQISQNGKTLSGITNTMQDSVEKIGAQIDLFKV